MEPQVFEVSEITFQRLVAMNQTARTERAYRQAYADLERVTGKPAIEASRADVERWVADMTGRGLSASTVQQRLSAVGSLRAAAGLDPVTDGLAPKRVKYGEARALSLEEAKALVGAIWEDVRKHPARGWLGMALVGGYLMTGRRPSEWREIRWGDIAEEDGHVSYRWCWKGVIEVDVLPGPVWAAIQSYLRETGRLKSIQPGDAIFTALSDAAERLPAVTAYDGSQPITDREACRIMRRYCNAARLDAELVSIRVLRNTAALLRREAGASITSLTRMLGMAQARSTENLLQRAGETRGSNWLSVAAMLGLAMEEKEKEAAPEKKRRRRRYS